MPVLLLAQSRLAHADRLEALSAPAGLGVAALAPMRSLQRLLTAIILPRALLTVRALSGRLVAPVSGPSRLVALAVPMTLLAWLCAMRAMAVRSAVAPVAIKASIGPVPVTGTGMLALLAAVRVVAV